ncbi:hypothetical protein [Paraflavitalea pollutisoli]|uniref:hypothetical protein n=1 Tax=Paraflavitalea pollutisoli TaxID=3034143 RepID=UPI0023EB55D9|nr:hypothetical protein [Paraflavitalea sp. H1-2-19X]
MYIPGYLYVELISLLASFNLFFRKDTPLFLKLFTPYLLLTLAFEITSWQLNMNEKSAESAALMFPSSAFEIEFYIFTLYNIIQTPRIRRVVLWIVFLYPVLAVFNIYYLQAGAFPSNSYLLGCILIVTICIYYFYELFHLPGIGNLLQEPAFWVCTALLFFYICSLPFFGLYNLMYKVSPGIMENISVILTVMNVFLYTIFTAAFLCVVRIPRLLSRS